MARARKKKLTIDKYNYGSYVTVNQQAGFAKVPEQDIGAGMLSGVGSGASIGNTIGGPMGGAIGAVGGFLIGGLSASSKNKRAQRTNRRNIQKSQIAYSQAADGALNSANLNPYGTYEDGGDVDGTSLIPINIEAGEVLVDPQTGKITREFVGINPETGGKYLPHATGRKKDTPHNIVTAEEGGFVITKAKAKEYKDAIKNNDKLAQNSIMHNIRNKKRQSMKFAEGGLVEPPVNLFPTVDWQQVESLKRPTTAGNQLSGVISRNNQITESDRYNANTLTYGDPNKAVSSTTPQTNNAQSNFNWGNLATALPAITNMIQGFSSPNYMKESRSPINPYRNQILGNMPKDVNYSPLFNRIYRDRNAAYNLIDETTNSSAVARANKLNVMANTQRGIQDTYFQGEEYNNRIRGQRAGIYNNLGQQELGQFNDDRRFNYGVGLLNRQMQEGRRQQVNYGLSQLGQLYQNTQLNTQLENRDRDLMRLLPQIYPALEYYMEDYKNGGGNGNR